MWSEEDREMEKDIFNERDREREEQIKKTRARDGQRKTIETREIDTEKAKKRQNTQKEKDNKNDLHVESSTKSVDVDDKCITRTN